MTAIGELRERSAEPDVPLQVGRPDPSDARRISQLLNDGAPDTIPQPAEEVLEHLDAFEVVHHPGEGVVACASLRRLDDHRAELRSVAVARSFRRHKLGSLLVRRAIRRAMSAQLHLVCVTMRPEFFASLGFREIPLEWVPEKPERCVGGSLPCGRSRVAMARGTEVQGH